MAYRLPRYIALCGHPRSGKSEVQKILKDHYNVTPVDDGAILRETAMKYLGLTHDQVYTQEGKKEFVEILGRRWQVREILGDLGCHFEEMFGPDIMPYIGMKSITGAPSTACFSFGSVRRDQGAFYQKMGGVVIGIANPLVGPSDFAFDSFNENNVDFWINNDAQSRGLSREAGLRDLLGKVSAALAAPAVGRAA